MVVNIFKCNLALSLSEPDAATQWEVCMSKTYSVRYVDIASEWHHNRLEVFVSLRVDDLYTRGRSLVQ